MKYFTLAQLATATGRTAQTIRLHIRLRYLKAEKCAGVRGWRVSAANASRWASKHFGIRLDA